MKRSTWVELFFFKEDNFRTTINQLCLITSTIRHICITPMLRVLLTCCCFYSFTTLSPSDHHPPSLTHAHIHSLFCFVLYVIFVTFGNRFRVESNRTSPISSLQDPTVNRKLSVANSYIDGRLGKRGRRWKPLSLTLVHFSSESGTVQNSKQDAQQEYYAI